MRLHKLLESPLRTAAQLRAAWQPSKVLEASTSRATQTKKRRKQPGNAGAPPFAQASSSETSDVTMNEPQSSLPRTCFVFRIPLRTERRGHIACRPRHMSACTMPDRAESNTVSSSVPSFMFRVSTPSMQQWHIKSGKQAATCFHTDPCIGLTRALPPPYGTVSQHPHCPL